MLKFRKITTVVVAALALAAISFQAASAASNRGGNDFRTRARLNGNTLASGKADYRERDRNGTVEQRFSVEVEDATPGAVMQIHVNDVLIGTIVIDDLGIGELQYRTAQFIDDPGDGDPIPDGFPTLIDGDTITVGPLAGTFVER